MNFTELRKTILKHFSSEILFRKHSSQILFAVGIVALILGIFYLNLHFEFNLAIKLLSSITLGVLFTSLCFFNHELLHGSMIKAGALQRILSYPGFFILAVSPELWLTWHNYVHHFHANEIGGADPDLASEWERLKNKRFGIWITRVLPGSGHWLSYVLMPVLFGVQSMNVFFVRSTERPELYRSVRRPVVIIETLAYLFIWALIFYTLPFQTFFFLFLIPLFIVNVVVINYVGLPHHLRPLSSENIPFLTTNSLKAPWIIDALTFNFSHHVEHHIFPEMNHSEFPRMRKFLIQEFPNDYIFVNLGTALKEFYSTPRAYADPTHLYFPETGKTLDLTELEKRIALKLK